MTDVDDEFVWCDIRWSSPLQDGHQCAQHKPGHEVHRCCCGAVYREGTPTL